MKYAKKIFFAGPAISNSDDIENEQPEQPGPSNMSTTGIKF